jgi:hypothetical protein
LKEFQGTQRLDLAVAFIGADWRELLAYHQGKLRVICWLSSANTNPYALEDLMKRPRTEVRQRDSMHCKVYLAPAIGAIVGSANLSKAALSEAQVADQDEAAVLVTAPAILHEIGGWFGDLWLDSRTRRIQRSDLAAAQGSWDNAKRNRPNKRFPRNAHAEEIWIPATPSQFDSTTLSYAKKVRSMDLTSHISEACEFVQSIEAEKFTRDQQRQLVDHIVAWTRHPGAYNSFFRQPIAKVRKGLGLLFDDGKSLRDRLEQISKQGYLAGLRMPSIGLLLYWRKPEDFPPYSSRTVAFLRDLNLIHRGLSASSPSML